MDEMYVVVYICGICEDTRYPYLREGIVWRCIHVGYV